MSSNRKSVGRILQYSRQEKVGGWSEVVVIDGERKATDVGEKRGVIAAIKE